MNRTEDKLFDNHFHKVLASKNNGDINAEVEEIEIKSDEANKIFRNAKIAVKLDGDEDFKPELEKPLLVKRDALDYYPQSKMYQVRKNVYKVVLESTLWYMLYMTMGEYNKDLKNVYKEVKEGSVKAAEVTAQSLGEMIRKELNPIFGDRNFFVRVDVRTEKHVPLGREGDIMVTYASLPKGTKKIVDNSLSITMISVRPFNEDGTLKEHGKVKAEAFRGTFFDANHKIRKDIKKMRAVKGDPVKVAQSIIKWFKKNKDILLEER